MAPVRLVLVRHGRTAWNVERRFLGTTDLALDDVGVAEAQALGRRLGGSFHAVYSSPLRRARDTAVALAPPDAQVIEALRELGQGDLEGLDGPTVLARFPDFLATFRVDPTHCRPPGAGAETLNEVQDRALSAVRAIAARHAPGESVAVVSHQMVIASVRCAIHGAPLAAWREYGVPNAGLVTLAWDGGALREHAAE